MPEMLKAVFGANNALWNKKCITTRKIENIIFTCKFNIYTYFYVAIYQVWKTSITTNSEKIENLSFTYKINDYQCFLLRIYHIWKTK